MFLLCLSLALAAQPADPADTDCRTLAKGDGYAVHAVRVGPRTPGPLPAAPPGAIGGFFGPRYAILHTDTMTGRMKKLVEGGVWSVQFPPMAINRTAEHSVTIAAATTGPDRLYVLVMKSSVVTMGGARPQRGIGTLQHVLYVYRLADGSTLQEVVLPEPRERLAGFNQDALDPDLIRVTPTTARVGMVEYRIGDRLELVESKP